MCEWDERGRELCNDGLSQLRSHLVHAVHAADSMETAEQSSVSNKSAAFTSILNRGANLLIDNSLRNDGYHAC